MKQLVLQKYGRFDLADSDPGVVSGRNVRVKTQFAGISFTDHIIYRGWYKYQKQHLPLPYVPGFEAVGTVVEVGPDTSTCQAGDKVVVLQQSGCFSAEIIASEENIIRLPSDTNLLWAASLPVNFFTAFHALHNIVRLFSGSNILIESAAGGVGGVLTQLASRTNSVTGLVGSPAKQDYVYSLGANQVFTYDQLPKNLKFDVIFTASGRCTAQYQSQLSKNGKLVIYGFHSLIPSYKTFFSAIYDYVSLPKIRLFDLVYSNTSLAGFNIIHLETNSTEYQRSKQAFLNEIEGKGLIGHNITTFPIEDYEKAFSLLQERGHIGKILLQF